MSNTDRIALLVAAVVVTALAAYAYRSLSGIVTLLGTTLAIVAVVSMFAILVGGTRGRRPIGFAAVLFLATIGIVVASWGRVSTRLDANRLTAELQATGPDGAADALAVSTTRAAAIIRNIKEIVDNSRTEIEGILRVPDLTIASFFETPAVVDPTALAAASERLSAFVALVRNLPADIERVLSEAEAEFETMDLRLPDSPRLLLLADLHDRIAADREAYLTTTAMFVAEASLLQRMADYLASRPGEYRYDPELLRARFDDTATDQGYLALVLERGAMEWPASVVGSVHETVVSDGSLALVEIIGAHP